MDDLDFKSILILIFLNKEKLDYNIYFLMKLLSVNYQTLEHLFEILAELELIVEDPELLHFRITEKGKDYLYSKYMNNIDLKKMNNIQDNKYNLKVTEKNIFYLPKNFKL